MNAKMKNSIINEIDTGLFFTYIDVKVNSKSHTRYLYSE